ncbi:MAG: alpha-glucosidase [Bacteroidia bacterium]
MKIIKRILRWTGRILLLAILLGLAWWGVQSALTAHRQRQVSGSISLVAKGVQSQYTVGDLIVHIEQKPFRLLVTPVSKPNEPLWSTVAGESFVQAGLGKATIEEHRGSFLIEDKPEWFAGDQEIGAIIPMGDSLAISGLLSGGKEEAFFYRFVLTAKGAKTLALSYTVEEGQANRIYLTYASSEQERFVGFGEQFSFVNMKGKRLPIFCMEQGIGRGMQPLTGIVDLVAKSGGDWHTSYAGVPFYLSNHKRSFFLENSAYSVFDLRKDKRVQVKLFTPQNQALRARIQHGDPQSLIRQHTADVGRMKPLPDWTQRGAIVGMQGGSSKFQQVHQSLSDAKVPLAGYWLQDWVGQRKTSFGKQLWWNWELDEDRYPGWGVLRDALAHDSIFLLGYVNPFLVDVDEKANAKRNLFKEALSAGYLVQNKSGEPYLIPNTSFSAGLVDLTNSCARDWLKAAIKAEMIEQGIRGWMADFGEALPYDAVLHDGSDPALYHNRYPETWAALNREIVDEDSSRELMFFSRAGYSKSPAYSSLFWLGDQMVTWDKHDGLQSAVTGLLSGGLTGYALNHSDIGGYTTLKRGPLAYTRDHELLLRWMEFSAFTALFRSHEGNQPELNIQAYTDSITREHFALTAGWFAKLAPYRKALMQEAAQSGMPLARHCLLHYPQDKSLWDMVASQFLLGADLLVVPVMAPDATEVKACIPGGNWEHIWTGKTYSVTGNCKEVTVAAPMGQPGLFIRKGSEWEGFLRKCFTDE